MTTTVEAVKLLEANQVSTYTTDRSLGRPKFDLPILTQTYQQKAQIVPKIHVENMMKTFQHLSPRSMRGVTEVDELFGPLPSSTRVEKRKPSILGPLTYKPQYAILSDREMYRKQLQTLGSRQSSIVATSKRSLIEDSCEDAQKRKFKPALPKTVRRNSQLPTL